MCFTFFELNWKKNTLNVSPSEWFLDVPDTGCTFIWDQIRTAMVLKVNSINRKQRHHFPLLSKRKILSNCHLILSNFIPTKSDATRQRMCISLPETSIPLNWLKKRHFAKNYLHYFGVQTKLFVWDMRHTFFALSKSPNIINLIITLSSDMLSTNSDILSQ